MNEKIQLTEELKAKLKACTSVEEILALAKENGMEISLDDAKKALSSVAEKLSLGDLENISGGSDCGKGCNDTCC